MLSGRSVVHPPAEYQWNGRRRAALPVSPIGRQRRIDGRIPPVRPSFFQLPFGLYPIAPLDVFLHSGTTERSDRLIPITGNGSVPWASVAERRSELPPAKQRRALWPQETHFISVRPSSSLRSRAQNAATTCIASAAVRSVQASGSGSIAWAAQMRSSGRSVRSWAITPFKPKPRGGPASAGSVRSGASRSWNLRSAYSVMEGSALKVLSPRGAFSW